MNEKQRYQTLYQSLTQDGEGLQVNTLLRRAAKKWPENTILICNDEHITYKELYQRSIVMAERLIAMGVHQGDRVLIFYENSIEFYIAYFAVWEIGAIVAPLNVYLHEAEFLHIVDDAQPKVLIISSHLLQKITSRSLDTLPPIISEIDKTSPLPTKLPSLAIPPRDTDAIATILYTSGTTGFPKGVMLSSRNIIINAIQGIARLEVTEQDRVFCPLPLFHSLPQNVCVWANTVLGATAITVSKIDRTSLLKGISHKPTVVIAVPALYGLFCMMKTIEFGKVKYFFSGGDALSDKVRSFFGLIYRRKIGNGYGLTETSPFLCADADDYTQPTNTVGKPFIGVSCSIRNEQNKEVPQGDVGILWVKGDNIMLGYYNAPEATANVLQDGWLNTGDLAYIDKNGKVVLAGRERDLIVNKGIKIYPQEVENVLLSHPEVVQAGVIGVKEDDEEIPVAFVASRTSNPQALIKDLEALCRRTLAFYKVPRKFIVKRELPVTTTGKVDKKILRAELAKK
jgi:long-chain acyl-CoA synthetase